MQKSVALIQQIVLSGLKGLPLLGKSILTQRPERSHLALELILQLLQTFLEASHRLHHAAAEHVSFGCQATCIHFCTLRIESSESNE